jgi:hypothetical protein
MDINKLSKIYHKHIVDVHIQTIINIYEKCKNDNIEIIIYKGIALSAQLYNDLYYRKSSDIDFVVQRENAKTILNILKNDGFRLQSDEEIDIENYEKYFYRSHLHALYKEVSGIKLFIEIHVNPLFNSERYFPNIDLFQNKQEITITKGYKIYTLSHNLNFSSLITHYVKHFTNFINCFFTDRPLNVKYKNNKADDLAHLKEIYLFYTKYNEHINFKSIVEIMDKNDTIEFLELFNHHFYEIFSIRLYEPNELIEYRNSNLYYQKNLCRHLLGISFEDFQNTDYNNLFVKFQSTFVYDPCKIITLYENQIFSEKIFVNNNVHFILSSIHPSYSVSYSGKDIDFNIYISKKYFIKKYINIDFNFKMENSIYLRVFSFHFDNSCSVFTKNKDIENWVSILFRQDHYMVNIKIKNIECNIIRYNIMICNRDTIGPLENHFSLTDTCQLYDPTKYCELHLIH